MNENHKGAKLFILNILNGISMGVIVALVPSALLSQLMTILTGILPGAQAINTLTNFAMTLMPVVSGVCIGMIFKMTPIQTSSLSIAAMIGAGNVVANKSGQFVVSGVGDVINVMITIAIGVTIIQLLGNKMKAYTVLLLPAIVLIIAGGIGVLTLTPIHAVTTAIGNGIMEITQLQPVLMGGLLGMVFAILIVSPISSVGIATAISLSGVAAGSANLGITVCGFALAIYGMQSNSLGTSLVHFLGSPKIQMANILKKPQVFIPVLIDAGIVGALGAALKMQGTSMSAGFGFSGLIGPLAGLKGGANLLTVLVLFVILPVGLGFASKALFKNQLHLMDDSDFLLTYN